LKSKAAATGQPGADDRPTGRVVDRTAEKLASGHLGAAVLAGRSSLPLLKPLLRRRGVYAGKLGTLESRRLLDASTVL